MSKYFKNFILCGEIDFFCLLCKESFETNDQIEKHIRWEQHRKLIKSQEYLPKLKKDCVYKLADKYYCEICNYVTSAFDTIKSHVKEESHKEKKLNSENAQKECLVKRDFDFVIVSKIVMNKKEWHGLVNNQCLFCNTAVDNFTVHITQPNHMIKLIQSEIIKTQDDQVYRKIHEDTFYCFKCKATIFHELLSDHWTSKEHIGQSNEDKTKVKQLFEIDRDNSYATCLLCKQTILWSYLPINSHRDVHISKGEWIKDANEIEQTYIQLCFQDKGKVRSELKKYGKDNFIKMNEGRSKGYCTLCNTYISAHIRNFRQHVGGLRHNSFLELKGLVKKTKKTEKPRYKTRPFVECVKEVIHVKSSGTFLIPSSELCINMMSFTMLAPIDHKKIVCFVCEGIYQNLSKHLTMEHKEKLFKTEVVTTLKGEFVREIRPGLYHCGVCNMSYAGWSVLEKHFNLFKHRYAKLEAHKKIEEFVDPAMFDCGSEGNCSADLSSIRLDDFMLD